MAALVTETDNAQRELGSVLAGDATWQGQIGQTRPVGSEAWRTAFTVDRAGTLVAGQTIDLVRHTDIDPSLLQAHVDAMFPNGVTQHGNAYFLEASAATTAVNPSIELLFDYVRRTSYPAAPSWFESVFGFDTSPEADAFRSAPGWGNPAARIFEVETDAPPFRADMTCLTLVGSILISSYVANRYWQQEAADLHLLGAAQAPPIWELLLTPPVRVLGAV
jgi:hypothetical protein